MCIWEGIVAVAGIQVPLAACTQQDTCNQISTGRTWERLGYDYISIVAVASIHVPHFVLHEGTAGAARSSAVQKGKGAMGPATPIAIWRSQQAEEQEA